MSLCELADTGMHAATFSALKPVTSDIFENCLHSPHVSLTKVGTKRWKYPVFFNLFIAMEPFGAFIFAHGTPHSGARFVLFYCCMPDIFLYLAKHENKILMTQVNACITVIAAYIKRKLL